MMPKPIMSTSTAAHSTTSGDHFTAPLPHGGPRPLTCPCSAAGPWLSFPDRRPRPGSPLQHRTRSTRAHADTPLDDDEPSPDAGDPRTLRRPAGYRAPARRDAAAQGPVPRDLRTVQPGARDDRLLRLALRR